MTEQLLYHGQRIVDALKMYFQQTNLSLHVDESKKKQAVLDLPDARIRDLVRARRIDEAVEIYQKFAGVDEYTAKDAVDRMRRG
jgi:hypothetical protein